MAKESILVIEDEKNIAELIKYHLEQAGFRVQVVLRGDLGLAEARKAKAELILLDLMLPEIDGLEICRLLKQNPKTISIPIIMLTAKVEEMDQVVGLELGADDYIAKPFSPRQLVARVKAVLRRTQRSEEGIGKILKAGTLELDSEKYVAALRGKTMELSSKEFELLKILMEACGRVLTREMLLDRVWGYDPSLNIETRTVDMHIGNLRKKLKHEASRIVTVKNVGYRFDREEE